METAFGDGTCARQLLPSQWRQLAAPLSGALAQSFLGRYPHPSPDSQAPPCEGPYVPFHTPDPAEALLSLAPTARSMDNRHNSPRLADHRSADLENLPDYHDQSSRSLSRTHGSPPNLHRSGKGYQMGSGFPRHVPASAHDWRHVLTFPTRLLRLPCPCIRSILAIRLAR